MHRLTIAACLALLPASFAAASDAPPQLLLYMSDSGPVFIRLHIEIEGKSYEGPWNDYVNKLFADLDRDGDGLLKGEETKRIPTRQQLSQIGLSVRGSTSKPSGEVTKLDLDKYLRTISGGPFSTNLTANNMPASRTRVLGYGGGGGGAPIDIFKKLDVNGDGKLAVAEFAMTKSLRKLDLDDDETIGRTELQPAASPYVFSSPAREMRNTNSSKSPFIHLGQKQRTTELVRRLLTAYDGKSEGEKDQKLSSAELGMKPEAFAKLDVDGDSQLDFDEVHQLVRNPATPLDIVVRLGEGDIKRLVEIKDPENKPLVDLAVHKSPTGSAELVVGKVQIEVGPDLDNRGVRQNYEANYKQMLKQFDRDNNAYLEKKETERSPFNNSFELIDVDGDGKIFEKELIAYAKQVQSATMSHTTLTITDQGNKLFQVLDINRDGRLNERELAAAQAKVAQWDENDDQQVTKEEIPRHWRLALKRGSQVRFGFAPVALARNNPMTARPAAAGPAWFRKMDRNHDGDVTRREFLGASRDFESLDKDQDGLLSATEAAAISPVEKKSKEKPAEAKPTEEKQAEEKQAAK